MRFFFPGVIYFLLAIAVNYGYNLLAVAFIHAVKPTVAGKKIEWIAASLQQISPAGISAFYPRMLQMKDGDLLVAYASKGSIIVQKSAAETQCWQQIIVAAEKEDGVNMDTPELLQLLNGEHSISD